MRLPPQLKHPLLVPLFCAVSLMACGGVGPTAGDAGLDAGAIADAGPGTLVLFGGEDGHSNCLGDTWLWQGAGWTALDVSGPSARAQSVLAPLNGQLVLFGGWYATNTGANQQFFSDTWTFDGAAWTQANVTGPSARDDAVLAPLGDKLVLFGGLSSDDSVLGETWTFDGQTWTQLNIAGPSGRSFATLAPLGNQLVLFGGKANGVLQSDTWTFDGTAWTQLSVSGPAARDSATMTTQDGQILLFGGYSTTSGGSASLLSDSWTWNGSAWTELSVTEPIARASAGMAPYAGEVILFGGYGPEYSLSDTWTWNGSAWSQMTVAAPPSGRTRPAMALLQ